MSDINGMATHRSWLKGCNLKKVTVAFSLSPTARFIFSSTSLDVNSCVMLSRCIFASHHPVQRCMGWNHLQSLAAQRKRERAKWCCWRRKARRRRSFTSTAKFNDMQCLWGTLPVLCVDYTPDRPQGVVPLAGCCCCCCLRRWRNSSDIVLRTDTR